MTAYVYLIHLDRPIHHARNYIGYTALEHWQERLDRHRKGNGARLLNVANHLGIHYDVVRVWTCSDWHEARALERQLKARKDSPKLCPICNPETAMSMVKNVKSEIVQSEETAIEEIPF